MPDSFPARFTCHSCHTFVPMHHWTLVPCLPPCRHCHLLSHLSHATAYATCDSAHIPHLTMAAPFPYMHAFLPFLPPARPACLLHTCCPSPSASPHFLPRSLSATSHPTHTGLRGMRHTTPGVKMYAAATRTPRTACQRLFLPATFCGCLRSTRHLHLLPTVTFNGSPPASSAVALRGFATYSCACHSCLHVRTLYLPGSLPFAFVVCAATLPARPAAGRSRPGAARFTPSVLTLHHTFAARNYLPFIAAAAIAAPTESYPRLRTAHMQGLKPFCHTALPDHYLTATTHTTLWSAWTYTHLLPCTPCLACGCLQLEDARRHLAAIATSRWITWPHTTTARTMPILLHYLPCPLPSLCEPGR